MEMMKSPSISEGECRVFNFPVFDFNGLAQNALRAGNAPLKMPTEGIWHCHGINATLGNDRGGLASGTNINFNIWDANASRFWFTGGILNVTLVAPLELKAGKFGDVHYFKHPRILVPGVQLILYASHEQGGTPMYEANLYMVLICTLAHAIN